MSTPKTPPVAELWFGIEAYTPNTFRLAEVHINPYAVGDIWLLRGTRHDVALDAGSGIVDPVPVLEAIAGRAVMGIALNSGYDHSGGWHGFTERACHAADAATLAEPQTTADEVFDYLTDEMFRALPRPGFKASAYRRVGATPTRLLEDGELLDLGERELHIIHTPGRSPGGLCIWEPDTSSLFSSEILYDGDHGLAWPPADPDAYCASLRRLRELPVNTVYPGHYGPFDGARMQAIIDEQLDDLSHRKGTADH